MSLPTSALPYLLSVVLGASFASACGGDDDGGAGLDGGDDDADAAPIVDGGGDDGPRDRAAGEITAHESQLGEDGYQNRTVWGSIVEERPRFHRLEMEEGSCRFWSWSVQTCDDCEGICDAEGSCVPYPTQLSAGTLTVSGLVDGSVTMAPSEYGYYPEQGFPDDLYEPGAAISASFAGGPDLMAFELEARGVDPIEIDLVDGGSELGDRDALRLEDGSDLTLSWAPARPGTRVLLEIKSENQGHGLPIDALIECEGPDTGSLTVPRAMVEAFPLKGYAYICVGRDCPFSTLTRYTWDRASVSGVEVELRVEHRREFIAVHEPG
jgi:hypothetical protein